MGQPPESAVLDDQQGIANIQFLAKKVRDLPTPASLTRRQEVPLPARRHVRRRPREGGRRTKAGLVVEH